MAFTLGDEARSACSDCGCRAGRHWHTGRVRGDGLQQPAQFLLLIADFDGDGHVDGTDADWFAACATGPGVANGPGNVPPGRPMTLGTLGLVAADLDRDNDVDMDDFAVFQLCVGGPDMDPPPECRG